MDLSTSVDYYNAQVAVLGALLINPDEVAGGVCQAVLPQDFSNSTLRNVYRAARQLYLEGKGIDPVVVVEAAGTAYERTVADVMRMTPTWVNWENYMRLLLDGSKLQRIRGLAEKLIDAASMEDARGLLAQAEGLLSDRAGRKAASYLEMVNDYLDRQNNDTPPRFLKWGEEHIDEKLNISPGRFIVIGADSSTGKTALALQFAYSMARDGHRVGFMSYETSTEDAADRIFANVAAVDLPRSKKKNSTPMMSRPSWPRVSEPRAFALRSSRPTAMTSMISKVKFSEADLMLSLSTMCSSFRATLPSPLRPCAGFPWSCTPWLSALA